MIEYKHPLTASERISVAIIAVGLLIIAIGTSPRIPLPVYIPGRRFDIRIEDILLSVSLLFWILYLFLKPRIYLTPLAKPISIYLFIIAVTTCIALLTQSGLIRPFFYFLKQVEYFLIFLFVANWVRSEKHLKLILRLMLGAGFINVLWVISQVIRGYKYPLVMLATPESSFETHRTFSSYGPCLIGEASPLSTAGFFFLLFLLSLSYLFFLKSNYRKKRSYLILILCIGFSICAILSGTKTSIVLIASGIITMLILFTRDKGNFEKILAISALIIILFIVARGIAVTKYPYAIKRVFMWGSYPKAIIDARLPNIWKVLLPYAFDRFFIGYGKGIFIPGSYTGYIDEPHNYYLTVLLESGIFGLIVFLWLLIKIIFLSTKVYSKSNLAVSKVIGCTTLAATVGLSIGAIAQDTFKPVLLNEFWWVLVGLTAAAYRIEIKNKAFEKYE